MMMDYSTASLSRSITLVGSKQTYYTARLMVDRDLVDDFCRAYAYFRWVDDIVDIAPWPKNEILRFLRRQKELIDRLYKNERPQDLAPEEQIVADLIRNDRGDNSGLQSFIRNMFSVVEFDAFRRGRLISYQELKSYTKALERSVTDGLLYFVGNGCAYPDSQSRYLAAKAAHITHLLRDMLLDIADGFINIPHEYLDEHGIRHDEIDSQPFEAWVKCRVEQARAYFRLGKHYLDEVNVLRCKIVGYWYCARFEVVLDAIERDGYRLRPEYVEQRNLSTWIKMAQLAVALFFQHAVRKIKLAGRKS